MPRTWTRICLGLGLAMLAGAAAPTAAADAGATTEYVLRPARLATPPVIDGTLSAGEWDGAPVVTGFVQFEPREGAAATEKTEARVAYDDENLYFAVRGHDSQPEKLVANILTRDGDLSYDDTIRILLDTFNDRQSGFLFATNPLGVKVDGLVRREGEVIIYDWDGDWTCAAGRDGSGFTIEIAIPFKTLRFRPGESHTWGFNIQRSIARKREEVFWKPMLHDYGSYAWYKVSELGELAGLEGIRQGGRYRFSPYVVAGRSDQNAGGDSDDVTDAGVDVKINLTSKLVADLTYSTDFAEAEADDQQVNLTRFPLLFAEKREFFLEGADLFHFGDRPEPHRPAENFYFFSRRIGLSDDGGQEIPVIGGAKITGEVGRLGVGALLIATESETLVSRNGGQEQVPETLYGVVRLRQKILEKSSFGLLALGKDPTGPDSNRVVGGDWDFALGSNLRTGGYLLRSSSPGIDDDEWAGYADVYWDSKHYRSHIAYTQLGDGFRNDLGFIPRPATRKYTAYFDRIFWPENKKVRTYWVTYFVDYVTDNDDNVETRVNSLQLNGFFQNSAGLSFKVFDNLEVLRQPFEIHPGVVIAPGAYSFINGFFGFQTDYSKKVGAAGRLLFGDFYDGNIVQAFAFGIYRPFDGFLTWVSYDRNEVDLPAGKFTTELLTADVNYSLSRPDLSVQLSQQWRDEENSLLRVLVKWGFRPGSRLYFVYENLRDLTDAARPFDIRVGLPGRRFVVKSVFTF